MERLHKILQNPIYSKQFLLLQEAEKDREFCRHTMEHFLDVARLMYIYNLEEGTGIEKELIYAAALLHDIGRYEQMAKGTPHDLAGVRMAEEILGTCGFSQEEIIRIQEAIRSHRSVQEECSDHLQRFLYRADKMSRDCFCCPSKERCNWPAKKKNTVIEY